MFLIVLHLEEMHSNSKEIIYLDLQNSGIAGDMMLSLLFPLLKDPSAFESLIQIINSDFPHVKIKKAKVVKTISLYKMLLKFLYPR